jgi:hypothetical protein
MGNNPDMPATWPEQKKHIGNLNVVGAQKLIKEISENQPHTLFHLVVVRILHKLIEENNILTIEEARISDIAWAVRNIMELRVMSAYVRLSQENLQRFEYDVVVSGATTMKALLELGQKLAGEVENGIKPTPSLYRTHADIQKTRVELGLGQEEPLKSRVCARQVSDKLEKEHQLVGSVTSDLIHPNAISVLKTFDLEVYRDPLVANGLILATKVILEIREHIKQYGYKSAK